MGEAIKMGGGSNKVTNGTLNELFSWTGKIPANTFVTRESPASYYLNALQVHAISISDDNNTLLAVIYHRNDTSVQLSVVNLVAPSKSSVVSELSVPLDVQVDSYGPAVRLMTLDRENHIAVFCYGYKLYGSNTLILDVEVEPGTSSIKVLHKFNGSLFYEMSDMCKGSNDLDVLCLDGASLYKVSILPSGIVTSKMDMFSPDTKFNLYFGPCDNPSYNKPSRYVYVSGVSSGEYKAYRVDTSTLEKVAGPMSSSLAVCYGFYMSNVIKFYEDTDSIVYLYLNSTKTSTVSPFDTEPYLRMTRVNKSDYTNTSLAAINVSYQAASALMEGNRVCIGTMQSSLKILKLSNSQPYFTQEAEAVLPKTDASIGHISYSSLFNSMIVATYKYASGILRIYSARFHETTNTVEVSTITDSYVKNINLDHGKYLVSSHYTLISSVNVQSADLCYVVPFGEVALYYDPANAAKTVGITGSTCTRSKKGKVYLTA